MIFGSGRPVLVLPEAPKQRAEIALDVIGLAWDFSRPAARAVADALPLLPRAKIVRVVTITNEKTIETRRSGSELARGILPATELRSFWKRRTPEDGPSARLSKPMPTHVTSTFSSW